jgi:hypothetical protein
MKKNLTSIFENTIINNVKPTNTVHGGTKTVKIKFLMLLKLLIFKQSVFG